MSAFWHIFVIAITVISIAGCLWLLMTQSRGKTGSETTHTWDDDLTEYNNPLPRWWLNLFIITIVFGVGYLFFYPGLGNVAGRLGWTSNQEMQARLDHLTAQRQAQYAKLDGKSVAELAHDPTAQSLGRSIFLANCAGCHGTDARGAIGFPNLSDKDWLYGGQPETVLTTIQNGRNGQMPSFSSMLPPEKVTALVDFLPYWSDPDLDAAKRAAGLEAFAGVCAACHGPDGKGNIAMGAPNLTDDVWLWGGRKEQIRETILYGRKNQMPAHNTLISADEARVVAGYVLSLSETESVATR